MENAANPFKREMVTIRRMVKGKGGKLVPDLSSFSTGGYEVKVDELGMADVPDWAAKNMEPHGYIAVDREAIEAEARKQDKKAA